MPFGFSYKLPGSQFAEWEGHPKAGRMTLCDDCVLNLVCLSQSCVFYEWECYDCGQSFWWAYDADGGAMVEEDEILRVLKTCDSLRRNMSMSYQCPQCYFSEHGYPDDAPEEDGDR